MGNNMMAVDYFHKVTNSMGNIFVHKDDGEVTFCFSLLWLCDLLNIFDLVANDVLGKELQ